MKNTHYISLKSLIIFFLSSYLFMGCTSLGKIIVQKDIVYHTKRITLQYYEHDYTHFYNSPIDYLKQTIVKKIKKDGASTITFYDIVALPASDFNLKSKVFMIIDNKVFPMKIEKVSHNQINGKKADTEDILTKDSTKVSVVTGYSEYHLNITRFTYEVNKKIETDIENAKQIAFRYYTESEMITVKLRNKHLKKLKKLIDLK